MYFSKFTTPYNEQGFINKQVNKVIISISHKIELIPNNKAKTHFKKAFGCSRLAYNWGLAKWQEYYKQGIKKSHLDLKKEFNAIL